MSKRHRAQTTENLGEDKQKKYTKKKKKREKIDEKIMWKNKNEKIERQMIAYRTAVDIINSCDKKNRKYEEKPINAYDVFLYRVSNLCELILKVEHV